ncbi:MAG: CGNR zinc finger domain-containing protein [Streptosporangiaceae bacterium]
MTEMPHLIGGALGLDFVNTVDPRHASGRREYLDSYSALVAWGSHAGVIDSEQGERLREAATAQPAEAGRVLSRAIGLREALYPLFSRAGRGPRPAGDDLGVLQAEVTCALGHFRVAWSPAGFGWEWDQASSGLDRMLWPVAWSAAELLVQGPLERIRECPGQDTCGWLFLDLSKNASRRWCDMRVCGNRAKARRHYERTLAPANRSRSRAASAV